MNRTVPTMAFVALLGLTGPAVAGGASQSAPDAPKALPVVPLGSSSEYATLETGSNAPDFSYLTLAGSRARLRDLRSQGHVLMVFGAGEDDLARLQAERDALGRIGVVPVAVLDWRAGAVRSAVRRLGLTYPVVPDPQRVIGAQFNALDPRTRQDAPAWFVIDRGGKVRGLDHFDWPREAWATIAAGSLGLPEGDTSIPASAPGR